METPFRVPRVLLERGRLGTDSSATSTNDRDLADPAEALVAAESDSSRAEWLCAAQTSVLRIAGQWS